MLSGVNEGLQTFNSVQECLDAQEGIEVVICDKFEWLPNDGVEKHSKTSTTTESQVLYIGPDGAVYLTTRTTASLEDDTAEPKVDLTIYRVNGPVTDVELSIVNDFGLDPRNVEVTNYSPGIFYKPEENYDPELDAQNLAKWTEHYTQGTSSVGIHIKYRNKDYLLLTEAPANVDTDSTAEEVEAVMGS